MLRSEFETLTGIYPSEMLYSVIEEFYNDSKLDKHEFCEKYKFNADGLAERIQEEANKLEQEDFPEIIKSAGLNGFAKTSDSPEKSVDELAKEVLENKWGTGADRKARLTAAGYSYEAVQNAVNALLKTSAQPVEKPVESADKSRHEVKFLIESLRYSERLGIDLFIDDELRYSGLLDD